MQSLLATFLVAAPDQPGLVARLAGFYPFAEGGPRFFMRLVVDIDGLSSPPAARALGGSATRATLKAAFADLAGPSPVDLEGTGTAAGG
jgi:formyltetrahydrofolate deformylase